MTQTPSKSPAAPENTPLDPDESWVTLARVVRPQGHKGELLAELLTDFPERFAQRRRLFLRTPSGTARQVTLEQHRLHKGRVVLKLEGIDSIEQVDALRGYEVAIPRAERAPLEQDAVYIGDLIGCVLYDRASAAVIGEILDLDRESSNMPLIVVRPANGSGELLIPFAKAYLPAIDLEARRMEMTLPEGLLALNAPLTEEERQAAAAAQKAEAEPGARAASLSDNAARGPGGVGAGRRKRRG